jgi:hypothetical protein
VGRWSLNANGSTYLRLTKIPPTPCLIREVVESALPLVAYALMLAVTVILPFWSYAPKPLVQNDPRWVMILLVGGAAVLTVLRGGLVIEGAVLLGISALGFGLRSMAGSVAAALLIAMTTWWLSIIRILPIQHVLAAAACLALALLARKCRFETSVAAKPAPSRHGDLIIVATLLVLGIVAGLVTGAINSPGSAYMAWHHWGAYLSPVQPLLAGAVPFRDFPVQYGMGPTLLIAATCELGNCWNGLYIDTLVANAVNLAVCGWSVLLLTRNMNGPSRLLALVALVCAALLWNGLPLDWGSPLMTPSVAGLRFLPLTMLLALVLTAETRLQAEDEAAPRLPLAIALPGHALWLLGLAWSPESAFFVTLLWWPWLALRRADAFACRKDKLLALGLGGMIGLGLVIVGYAALALLFRWIFGDWVSLGDFLLYLRYPPGRLPVFALGAVWLAMAILLLALVALAYMGDQPSKRRSLQASLLTALAAGSYYLSRSHDNNILNLLPFLILLLLAVQSARPTSFNGGFTRATLAGIIALTASIHFHDWTVAPGATSIAGLQLGPSALVSRFSAMSGPLPLLVPTDAATALSALRRDSRETALLFDVRMVMPSADPATTWTGVNNAANFLPLPPEFIRHYVRQGAKQFRRSGWIVVANSNATFWTGLFGAAYDKVEQRSYGSYTAYHLVPRQTPLD